ncbi:hypothetical protein [Streptomyces sp. CAI-21]|uniref:hypothetical protein n=1 Tax=Streptomyces sp. CAI-21 TaxID=1169743 RepID=UPI0020CA3BB6
MPRTPAPRPSASPALDARVALLRRAAHAEPRLEGVLLYGSWTTGEADAYSDTDHWLTPSRAAEDDLPVADLARYTATTASLEAAALAPPPAPPGSGRGSWPPRRTAGGGHRCRRRCTRGSRGCWPGSDGVTPWWCPRPPPRPPGPASSGRAW